MDRELLRNGSGYVDPTAYNALNNVQKGINKMENMKANRNEPKQGDVYFISKKDMKTGEFKDFPAVVVSTDEYNERSEYIIVADVSGKASLDWPENVDMMCRTPSVAMCDRLRNVKRESFGNYIRTATDKEMKAVNITIGNLFGIKSEITLFECDQEKECEAIQAKIAEQEQIIEKQKEHILELRDINDKCLNEIHYLSQERIELKAALERQAKEIKELNAMNNEMAGIAVELEDSGQQSDFYLQFYHDLFHSDKKIEIKVG